MKKIYHCPCLQTVGITTEHLVCISGGDSQNNVNISSNRDDSSDDNRVKNGIYNVWEDDWNK